MTDRHWSLLTKTRAGVVSILRDLTLAEAKAAYMRLDPKYGVVHTTLVYGDGNRVENSRGCIADNNTIELRAVFGPPTWDSDEVKAWDAQSEWPKHEEKHLSGPAPHWLMH